METKPLAELSAAERTERFTRSHQSMVAERKAALERDGMSEREAYAKANGEQLRHTNRARAQAEGRG